MLWDNLLQRLYRGLFENSKDAIFITTREGTILDANQAFLELFGYLEEELLTMSVSELYVDKGVHEAYQHDVIQKGAVKEFEVKLKKKEGKQIDCIVSSSVHYATDGSILGYQNIVRDVTKRRRAEKLQAVSYSIADAAYRGMDLNKLFKHIHSQLDTIIDTKNFYIALYNETKSTVSFPYYVDENYESDYRPLERPVNGGITDYVIKLGKPFFAYNDEIKQLISEGVVKTVGHVPLIWLGLPLVSKDKIIGVIAVQSYSNASQYTKADLELLEFVSGQIAVTIERKQAEESIKRTTDNLNALIENTTSGIFSLDTELRLLTFNRSFAKQFARCFETNLEYGKTAADVLPEKDAAAWEKLFKKALKGEQINKEQKFKVKDENLFFDFSLNPIVSHNDEITGITVFVKNVTEEKIAQETQLSEARQKLRQELKEQQIRAEAIITGQDEERQRIALELHDGLGQMLTAIKLNLGNLSTGDDGEMTRQLKEIKKLLNETMAETKRVSQNLMPSILKDFGLVPTIELLCENSKSADTSIIFQSFGLKGRYDQKIERGLYRIAQEAINNSLKYAKASEINELLEKDGKVQLMIEDDGVGFEVETMAKGKAAKEFTSGLHNMQERATLLKGKFNIDSSPGNGSVVSVQVPAK
jgi:PAS domain S-box-containing protein